MGRTCQEIHEWIEEEIEQTVEEWVQVQEERCEDTECNWWTLCLNKVVCWFVWVTLKVVHVVVVIVGKWVIRVVCEIVSGILDAAALLVLLIFSIPILGGILRTLLNWWSELFWRLISIPDFVLSLVGIKIRKKMYVGAVVPKVDGAWIATDAEVMRQVEGLTQLYKERCNIRVIFTGICKSDVSPPDDAVNPSCDASGFFHDWWLAGSFFEFATLKCRPRDAFWRVIGRGAEIIMFAVKDFDGDTRGCSYGSTHNYVLIEFRASHPPFVAAHEIGHSCWLLHRDDEPDNLMHAPSPTADPQLTNWQVAHIRWSKFCVYL